MVYLPLALCDRRAHLRLEELVKSQFFSIHMCVCVCIPWQRFSQVSASACILGKGTIFDSMVFQRVLLRIFFRFEFLFFEPQLYSLIYSHSKKKKFNGTVKSTFQNLRLLYSERWYCYQPEPTKFATISALVQRRKLVFT
jgi:hypothetical protein